MTKIHDAIWANAEEKKVKIRHTHLDVLKIVVSRNNL